MVSNNSPQANRPLTTDEYYMSIAMTVRKKANCLGRKVGAVLVRENRIISTGYNGTPEGMKNCLDGGCVRCLNRETWEKSVGYDVCICVHAEQNALITAARFGIPIESAIAYSTMRPCFDCTKALLQAKVTGIYYLHDWNHPIESLAEQYEQIQDRFTRRVRPLKMHDDEAAWANNSQVISPARRELTVRSATRRKSSMNGERKRG
jgi:dCMP deaminase